MMIDEREKSGTEYKCHYYCAMPVQRENFVSDVTETLLYKQRQ